ncbi:MAG: MoxR family ATPase [Gammaproteobacteria bacterium]|nr:MoxR family ATPase [Gammaproteobacteria bacterium]MDH5731980.1 MoxR family ATPase [Gammaproteobacteria bacterium]
MMKNFSIAKTFGINAPEHMTVDGNEQTSNRVPMKIPYVFQKDLTRDVLCWHQHARSSDGLFLFGLPGTGKSSVVSQIANRLNIPVYQKTVYRGMEFADLLGFYIKKGDSMEYLPGVLELAMGYDGNPGWLLLDDIDRADPGILSGLHDVFVSGIVEIPEHGSTLLKAKDGFRFVATGNSNMQGDNTGMNPSVNRQDLALLDRFYKREVDFPNPSVEFDILKTVSPTVEDLLPKIIEVANHIRNAHRNTTDAVMISPLTMSLRDTQRWAQAIPWYAGAEKPLLDSLNFAMLNTCEEPTKVAVRKHLSDVFGEQYV